jgi:hypothetical protein
MLHIKNEQSHPEGKEANPGNNVGNSLDYYSKLIENCTISEQTKRFLACIKMLTDLYGCVYDAIKFMYGEDGTDRLIDESYTRKSNELESVLYDFLRESISDNLSFVTITKV